MRYALINSSGVVENVIVWDGETPYNPGEGFMLVRSDTLNIGDISPLE